MMCNCIQEVSEEIINKCNKDNMFGGEYHTIGSLYTSKRKSPKKDIIKALECAENFVVSVQRPFIVKEKWDG